MKRLVLLLLLLAWSTAGWAAGLPEGITVLPDKPDLTLAIFGANEPGRWLVQDLSTSAFSSMTKVAQEGKEATLVSKPGRYNILFIPKADASPLKAFVIELGGGTPGPAPDPVNPPTPPVPVPGVKYQLMFFYDSPKLDNLTRDQKEVLSSLVFRDKLQSKGHKIHGILDPKAKDNVPPALAPFYAAVEGKSLPCVTVAPRDGGAVKAYDLKDVAQVWQLVGGE